VSKTVKTEQAETGTPMSSRVLPATPLQLSSLHGTAILVRAGVSAIAALVITFSADHSPALGLLVFGVFAVATGLVVAATAIGTISAGGIRSLFLVHASVGVLVGVTSLLSGGGDLRTLMLLVAIWAAITGFIELLAGLRTGSASEVSRDWVFIGFLTAVLAVTAVVLPREIRDPVVGVNGVETYLTSSVMFVGAIGAYCAVVAVYIAIAGLTLTWARRPTAVVAADGVERP
jgi:hypothetical protein